MRACNISVRDMQIKLKQKGYRPVRQTGDHQIWTDGIRTAVLPVNKLKPVIARKLIKEYNLSIQ